MITTIAKKARKKIFKRTGQYQDAINQFYSHYPSHFNVVEIDTERLADAVAVDRRHPLRKIGGSDCLHVAVALFLTKLMDPTPVHFICADRGLREVAKLYDFWTFNPETDDLDELAALERGFLF